MTWRIGYKLLLLIGLSAGLLGASGGGCGGENLFEGIAEDDSRQAKIEAAQIALDKEDCQTALNLFTEAYGSNPSGVKERIDLSAAYVCKAGFRPTALLDVAADFKASQITDTQLFNKIADKTIVSLDSTWDDDIGEAKELLAQDPNTNPPVAYNNNPDAGFNLSIVVFLEGVMTVVDILNFVDGIVDCPTVTDCQISDATANAIVTSIQNASSVLSSLGISSNVGDSVNEILTDIRAINLDGDANTTNCAELIQYLDGQNFDVSGVSCV